MCGITGILAYHPTAPKPSVEELRRMRDHMQARGPDGKGEWQSPDGQILLGHRRLAIIDLDPRAAQPMVSDDNRLAIVFNGEIYNYRALRARLEGRGIRFRTQSDTEVLLHLYAHKGIDMLHDLRGMFAFGLWDAQKRKLLLARDPYGIKPLYYADDGNTLRFASQVKALLAGGAIARQVEPAGLAGFYIFGSVPEPWTIQKGIRALPAGSYLWADHKGAATPVQWHSLAETWRQAEATAPNSQQDIQQQISEALHDTVSHHRVADVPVGAFLSAGIDSGALLALMTENTLSLEGEGRGEGEYPPPHPIKTITLAFEEFRNTPNDESPLAQQIAERYGADHTTRYVSEQEFRDDLPKILHAMDQPSIDGLNTWFVSKAASEQGLKVAISGLGGDELFGGYPSFRDIPQWVRRIGGLSKLPGAKPLLATLTDALYRSPLRKTSALASRPKLQGIFRLGDSYAGAYLLKRGLFLPDELHHFELAELLEQGIKRLNPSEWVKNAMQPEPNTPFAKVATLESAIYMRNQLLRDCDWASMAHSLEVRVPLVDAVLLQHIAPLLVKGRLNGKTLLGNAPARPLPENVILRWSHIIGQSGSAVKVYSD